jgi:hypothetical protein
VGLDAIIEAKTLGREGALWAVRQAVRQLFEYRHLVGPQDAELCILLNAEPGEHVVTYAEQALGIAILWFDDTLRMSPRATSLFRDRGPQ